MAVNKKRILKAIFSDPRNPAGLSSPRQLYLKARVLLPTLTLSEVIKFCRQEKSYSFHRAVKRKFVRRKTITKGIDDQWQGDLIDLQSLSKHNNNMKYLMVVIDCFSRFLMVEPMKNKTADESLRAFKKILYRSNRKPNILQVDEGKEFLAAFRNFLKEQNIHFFSTSQDTKCAIVERANRTLKNKIFRYMTGKNTKYYLPVLQQIVDGYNNTKHGSINMAPIHVNAANENILWKAQYMKELYSINPIFKFKIGDEVRITKYKKTFQRGFHSAWKDEIFTILYRLKTKPVTYILKDSEEEVLTGGFYEAELNKRGF